MFKQLSYFHTLSEDISNLAHSSQQLNQLLAEAYSSPSHTYCTIQAQIDNIIQEQQLLQNTLANIDLQVTTNKFVPERLDELQLRDIEPSQAQMPNWLPFVLDQEYASYRQKLNNYALQLLKTHNLDEKRKALSKQRQDLMELHARSVEMGLKGFQQIDLLQEASHLHDRIKHVRKTYEYFCIQISKKVVQFVKEVMAKSKNFHKNTARPINEQKVNFDHYQISQKPRDFLSPAARQSKERQTIFSRSKIREYQYRYHQNSSQSKGRANFYSPQLQQPPQPYHHPHQHYYHKSKQIRTQSTQSEYPIHNPVANWSPMNGNTAYNSSHHCHNHEPHKSRKAHQHTCGSRANILNRQVAIENQMINSSRSRVFDYRSVLRNDYFS